MATIMEMLLATMTDDEKKIIRKKLADNPQLIADDAEAGKLLSIYREVPVGEEEPVVPAVAAHVPVVPAVAGAAPAPVVATTVSTDSATILAKLTEMNTTLDTRFKTLETKMVSKDDLPKYRDEMTATAIKAADDYALVRETYRDEFGKAIDRAAFEKFINDQQTAGIIYRTDTTKTGFQKALDAFVSEDRIKSRVDKGIEDGVKQKLSGQKVPGSTQQIALSPAQQVIAKAKAAVKGGERSNLQSALSRLDALDRSSDERSGGVVN